MRMNPIKSVSKQSPFLTLAKYSLLFLVFTPFIVDRGVFFPFIEGKTVFIRAVVTLTAILLAGFFVFARKEEKLSFIAGKTRLFKNPLTLFAAVFLFSFSLSAVLAKSSYRAFFGTVERGEGLVGILFFAGMFFLALFIFERREWRLFFTGVLAGGVILFVHQIIQLAQSHWDTRPFATVGNPAFLAGYFLFVIFAAFAFWEDVIFRQPIREKMLKYAVLSAIFVSAASAVAGIFLSQTRGTFLGLAAGITAALLYFGFRALLLKFPKARLPITLALLAFIFITIGAGAVVVNQAVSGGAVAQIIRAAPLLPIDFVESFLASGSFETRLIAARVSLNSVLPANEGWGRFLFGWGPDNFNFAYNKYFDPKYFLYEDVWFDRAHNRVLDALVMQGLFGLFVFLGIWGSVLWCISRFKIKIRPLEVRPGEKTGGIGRLDFILPSAAVFFAVSYFVHGLFLFDTPVNSLALFIFFAFVIYKTETRTQANKNEGDNRNKNSNRYERERKLPEESASVIFWSVCVGAAALVALWLFVWATWTPYLQMKSYVKLKGGGLSLREFTDGLDGVLYPYTYAQERIRIDLVKLLPNIEPGEGIAKLVGKTFEAMDELIEREPYEPRYSMNAGQNLEEIGEIEFWKKAEEYHRKSFALAPNRPDMIYLLGQNLLVQGRFDEGKEVLDRILEVAPDVPAARLLYAISFAAVMDDYPERNLLMFSFDNMENALSQPNPSLDNQKLSVVRELYEVFMYRFYLFRDEENFLRALSTAKEVEEKWEKLQEKLFLEGQVKSQPTSKRSEEMSRLLGAFSTRGWEAIRLEGDR